MVHRVSAGGISFQPHCSGSREVVHLHLGMSTFRLRAPSSAAPNHMFGKWRSQDSNQEMIWGRPGSSKPWCWCRSLALMPQGLEITLASVPSPQAGHEDLEAVPPDTQTCPSQGFMGKSGQLSCTRRGQHLNLSSHKDNIYPVLDMSYLGFLTMV